MRKLILLVEPDPHDRDHLGASLEAAGYGLMDCPGPRREDFTCLGIHGRRCALVEIADLAILDARALQAAGVDRKPAARLLHYYLSSDKPVLVLTDQQEQPFSFENDRVAEADRSNSAAVLTAVTELLTSIG
jgi:hypothetical protein